MVEVAATVEQDGDAEGKATAEQVRLLAELSVEERERAWQKYLVLYPCLHGKVSISEVARSHHLPLKTVQRWVRRYHQENLVGLAHRRRSDRGVRRNIPPECQLVIEGMALTRPKRSIAHIHRDISRLAKQRGWPDMRYETVYAVVRAMNPSSLVLAHEGSRAYQEIYDLLYLQEVERPNERWQADHCLLNIWLIDDQGKVRRVYLTIILDDYSRAIMGYRLSFDAPSAYQTGLTLRQAIGKKEDEHWPACGIPETFYTDHGSDFTSKHMEQVAGQLSMQLIFSQVGRPRGRGKCERFFRSVKQIVLPGLPGCIPQEKRSSRSARKRRQGVVTTARQARRQASMTLADFDAHFRTWVLETYHHRRHRRLNGTPLTRWQEGKWLPRLPKSQNDLDLLLLCEAKTRQVQQEGIHFQGCRYMDVKLAGYVLSTVRIYYDPFDLRTITVYTPDGLIGGQFLCQARCQDFEGQKVSLKELVATRNKQRGEEQTQLKERKRAVEQARLSEKKLVPSDHSDGSQTTLPPVSKFKPPHFMAQISPEFVRD